MNVALNEGVDLQALKNRVEAAGGKFQLLSMRGPGDGPLVKLSFPTEEEARKFASTMAGLIQEGKKGKGKSDWWSTKQAELKGKGKEKLSNCCGAPPEGETSKGAGQCGKCKDGAMFEARTNKDKCSCGSTDLNYIRRGKYKCNKCGKTSSAKRDESLSECKVGDTVSGHGHDWKVEMLLQNGGLVARNINDGNLRKFSAEEAEQFTKVLGAFGEPEDVPTTDPGSDLSPLEQHAELMTPEQLDAFISGGHDLSKVPPRRGNPRRPRLEHCGHCPEDFAKWVKRFPEDDDASYQARLEKAADVGFEGMEDEELTPAGLQRKRAVYREGHYEGVKGLIQRMIPEVEGGFAGDMFVDFVRNQVVAGYLELQEQGRMPSEEDWQIVSQYIGPEAVKKLAALKSRDENAISEIVQDAQDFYGKIREKFKTKDPLKAAGYEKDLKAFEAEWTDDEDYKRKQGDWAPDEQPGASDPMGDEPREVPGDTEGLDPHETNFPHGQGYPNINRRGLTPEKVVRIDSFGDVDYGAEDYREDDPKHDGSNPENYPAVVSLYDVTRELGGHEEGGWWYDWRTLVQSVPVKSPEEAQAAARQLFGLIPQADLDGKPEIALERTEGAMEKAQQRPRYESAKLKETGLGDWTQRHGGTDSLRAGFEFPLEYGQTVTVTQGFRSNCGYLKPGTTLTFVGLGAYSVLFKNEHGKFVRLSHEQLRHIQPTEVSESVEALVRKLLGESTITMTVYRVDPATEEDLDVPVEVELDLIPGSRGARDSLGGRMGAGPPLEPDEPATAEVTSVIVLDDELAAKFPNFELTPDEEERAIEQAVEQAEDTW